MALQFGQEVGAAEDDAEREVPVWRMIASAPEHLRQRAEGWKGCLEPRPIPAEIISGLSTVGGGSLPGETLPTFLLALTVSHADRFMARLRQSTPPVIARVEAERVVFDPRTVLPEQDELLINAVREACSLPNPPAPFPIGKGE